MSKSAIKYLTAANEILSALDLTIGNPASWMTNDQARAQFKNADLLACLIIDSAANALICENVDTLDETMYDDMQQAIEGYISSNLDDWNQAEWKANASLCDVKALLAKLMDAVEGQRNYAARQEAHAEALVVNAIVDRAVQQARYYSHNGYLLHIGRQRAIDVVREELLNMERYPARFIVKMMYSVLRLSQLAQEQTLKEYREMMARPRVTNIDSELPF
nr:MAG: hypothetical protein [Bacteriophage sp.]